MPRNLSKEELSKYVCIHSWLKRHYGKATKCEKCGNPNNYKCEWANISGEYRRDRSDFMQLCQSCHKKHDKGDSCKRGHKYTKETTFIRKDGNRQCKLCARIATKKHNLKRKKNVQMGKSK